MGDEYYNQIAPSYEELHGEEQLSKAKLVLQNLEVKPSDLLLDVGCGTGHATSIFPCQKQGIDPAVELLKQAKIPVTLGVAENLPFSENSFDIVLSLTAIHNCNDVQQAIKEINRVAKRDIVISVLKKARNFKEIEELIKSSFSINKQIEESHDTIFICSKL